MMLAGLLAAGTVRAADKEICRMATFAANSRKWKHIGAKEGGGKAPGGQDPRFPLLCPNPAAGAFIFPCGKLFCGILGLVVEQGLLNNIVGARRAVPLL